MVRPAGPTEVLEILLNSTEVQTQRDVEMKSPPRLLGFRFDDDAVPSSTGAGLEQNTDENTNNDLLKV